MSAEQKYLDVIDRMRVNTIYHELKKIEYNSEVEKTIQELKEKYVDIMTKKNLADVMGMSELADEERHAEQSETLGKLIILVHNFKGFKEVEKVVLELQWEIFDIIEGCLSVTEKELEKVRGGVK